MCLGKGKGQNLDSSISQLSDGKLSQGLSPMKTTANNKKVAEGNGN
jgi:hypothetical protein